MIYYMINKKFQFLYGAIKSEVARTHKGGKQYYFNSSMVRLKDV